MTGGIAGLEAGRVLLEARRVGRRFYVLLSGDELIGQHPVEHQVAASQALGVVEVRVVAPGELDDPGDHGRLGQVHLGDVLVEVRLGRGLNPVGAVAQVHGVEVLQQDEVLAVLVLEAGGVPDFLELSASRLFGITDDGQLHVLLGDGRAALADTASLQVCPCGPDDGLQVDAIVDVEPFVLDGDDGVTDHPGDFEQGAGAGPVLWGYEGGDGAAVAGNDHRRFGLFGNGDLKLACLVLVARGGQDRRGGQRTAQFESDGATCTLTGGRTP